MLDTIKLLLKLAAAVLWAVLYAYYWYESDDSAGVSGAGLVLAGQLSASLYRDDESRRAIATCGTSSRGSRVEIRKVVLADRAGNNADG